MVRSSAATLGNPRTRSRWNRARTAGSSARDSSTSICGASSRTPGSKTTKKFGSNRAQSTRRRLATSVSISTPWTFHVTRSPISSCRSSAMSTSTEIRGTSPRGASSHQAPATICSDATNVSR